MPRVNCLFNVIGVLWAAEDVTSIFEFWLSTSISFALLMQRERVREAYKNFRGMYRFLTSLSPLLPSKAYFFPLTLQKSPTF